MPVVLTAHSASFVVVPGLGGCVPQLTEGVDITSDVKDCQPIFLGLLHMFSLGASEEPELVICDG
jgi:hypothetical protein